jgi:hypothetical protein
MTGQALATSAMPLDGDLVLAHDECGTVPWVLSRYPGEAAVGAPSREWTLLIGLDLSREWAVDLWSLDGADYRRIEAFRGTPRVPPPVPSRLPPAARPVGPGHRRRE